MPNIISKWRKIFENVPLDVLKGDDAAAFYNVQNCICDQAMLHSVLESYQDSRICYNYHGDQCNVFNYDGNFIHQQLRTKDKTLKDRTEYIKNLMEQILGQ